MKVLVKIKGGEKEQFYLVRLRHRNLIDEVESLLCEKECEKAIFAVLTRGEIQKEIERNDVSAVSADLILTERNARWDLC